MKDWQKGYELPTLKAVSALFKEQGKPYALGAFSIPNEAAIASALSVNRCIGGTNEGTKWAAILAGEGRDHHILDFSGRSITLDKSHRIVTSFGWQGKVYDALSGLLRSMEPGFVMVIFEEDDHLKKAIQALGFKFLSTVVEASSELKGFYGIDLPAIPKPLPA